MSASLYITEVEKNQVIDKKKEESQGGSDRKEGRKSYCLTKTNKEFYLVTDQVLDFMVNEESQFTDLLKIEERFKEKSILNSKAYNVNIDLIARKEQILKEKEIQVERVNN